MLKACPGRRSRDFVLQCCLPKNLSLIERRVVYSNGIKRQCKGELKVYHYIKFKFGILGSIRLCFRLQWQDLPTAPSGRFSPDLAGSDSYQLKCSGQKGCPLRTPEFLLI
jgi:hypothetical protein